MSKGDAKQIEFWRKRAAKIEKALLNSLGLEHSSQPRAVMMSELFGPCSRGWKLFEIKL
jgi:hypothetical protein